MRHQGRTTYDCDLCGKKDCGWSGWDGSIAIGEVKFTRNKEPVHLCKSCDCALGSEWNKVVDFMKSLVAPVKECDHEFRDSSRYKKVKPRLTNGN